MKLQKFSLAEMSIFIFLVLIFIFFGQVVGWRAVGIFQIIFSFKIIKDRRIAVGWRGFEPSFYITGASAVILGLFGIGIAIMLLFYPEQTVMKLK